MKTLILSIFACLATCTSAAPGGVHGGVVLSGPSGVVTNHGAIGPAALGLDGYGAYGGYGGPGAGAYVAGPAGPSAYVAGPSGPSAYVSGPAGPSAYVAGPAVSHASVVGPAAGLGLGYGGGFGPLGALGGLGHGGLGGLGHGGLGGFGGYPGYGGYRSGLGLSHGVTVTNGGGTVGVSPHGVTVKGPPTVPATIAGPAGKVVADGLYGVPTHGHGW